MIWIVLTIFVLSGYSVQNVVGSIYYPLSLQSNITVTAPPVILQAGTAGTSTIYTNNTSALVNVVAPVSTYDFVDNNTSDVDGSPDKGTHSNFTAQQYGPDSTYDTLTEESTSGTSSVTEHPIQNMNFTSDTSSWNYVLVSGQDIAGGWDNTGQTGGSAYVDVTTRNEAGEAYWNQSFSATVNSTLQSVNLNFRWKVEVYNVVDSGTLKVILVHPNGTSWELWTQSITGTTAWSSLEYVNITNYVDANGTYSLRLDLVADLGNDAATQLKIYYDDSGVALVYSGGEPNYELDLEVQWINVNYTRTNEELCIKTGTTDAEDVKVDVWNGTTWCNIFTDLTANSWNNVSVTDYLTSSTFTIRFKGGIETGDTTQDNWNIDATLLHVWTENHDYVLKVNNTFAQNWNIRLKAYDETNIGRLQNCTIYFHNGGGTSYQIYILNGVYNQTVGDWYTLEASSSDYIAIMLSANSTGTSYVYVYLEILVPATSTYSQYVITFEIT